MVVVVVMELDMVGDENTDVGTKEIANGLRFAELGGDGKGDRRDIVEA